MTWAKYGAHFFDDLTDFEFPDELDDACQLTHTQAIHFVYSTENTDVTFPRKQLRRFATSSRADDAAAVLIASGAWEMDGNRVRIVHHAREIRQSLAAQNNKREKDRATAARRRDREKADREKADGQGVGSDVAATHSFIHSSSHSGDEKQVENQAGNSTVTSFFDRVEGRAS